jgi:hypothetical protein
MSKNSKSSKDQRVDDKKCKRFCTGTFLKERERVESVFAKEYPKYYDKNKI